MSNEENQETSPEEYPTPYEYILNSPVEDAQMVKPSQELIFKSQLFRKLK
jgi:hypothetical protein